ncbi:MAG: Dot/Icm secretion system ATPase DotB [Gammaproteobacteria bacterium RIFCSPHIGHO2_12_FULL_35_23]|nr:MAG: Dot/Icm secretion system ATPase DotB [Gammaproteobacteria bacterium RIFCSPHIGHO2_12_FULL_35_23]
MTNQFIFKNEPIRFTQNQIDEVLVKCYQAGASDITFQTNEPIIAEVYGALNKITNRKLTNSEISEIINFMYGPNGTAQILSGKDIDTHYEIRPTRSERYRFRINGTGCMVEGYDGIQITARSIPNEPPDLTQMEIPQTLIDALLPEEGVVYVTGATGSGKSTLLAAIIKNIISKPGSNRKVLTYESPIEFVYDSIEKPSAIVSQSEIPRHLESFAAGVRNALRRKPRLILVGEARDQETISAVMEAAMTGHPVYTTLHSNGVAETIRRLVNTFPKEERHGRTIDIFETIRVVIWQKLVPSLDGKRVAMREYLVFNEQIRDILLSSEPDEATAVTRKLLKEHGQTMEQDANNKFKEGIISERDHRILVAYSKKADKDAGI